MYVFLFAPLTSNLGLRVIDPIRLYPSINPELSTTKIDHRWLKRCCRLVPLFHDINHISKADSTFRKWLMGPADYALQLQFLLRNLHPKRGDADSNSTLVSNPPMDFIRFIYFQCFPTIKQRLYRPVRPGSRAFKDIFSDDGITSDELRLRFDKSAADECPPLDQKILLRGDEWIVPYWKLCHRGREPEFEQCGDQKFIVPNQEMTVISTR